MHRLLIPLGAAALFFSGNVAAADYALSPDGLAVVRLTSSSPVSASTFNSSLLPSGYTSSTTSGGSLSVTNYGAGYKGGAGGGEIEALFTPPASLGADNTLKWVQVLTTNDPLSGHVSPYLDSSPGSHPFYPYGASNAAGPLSFYDFSKRFPSNLATTNPIVWNANLYPVAVDASNHNIQVYDGVSWGWTMTKAPVGTTSAVFTNPTPAGATVAGVGTSTFAWGAGGSPSFLNFTGTSFDTTPGERFKIGTLTFHNGVIDADSGANSVVFEAPIHFTNIPELDFTFKTTFTLTNTPNSDDDPEASADIVSIGSFDHSFHVLEGETASVDVMAILDVSLEGTPGGTSPIHAAGQESDPLDPSPHFVIKGLSFENPSSGGFITQVPEPSTWVLLVAGLAFISFVRRYAPQQQGEIT